MQMLSAVRLRPLGEPFTTTVTVSLIFALILCLPVLIAQAYAFLMPAASQQHRRQLASTTVAIPMLFVIGVAFGYFVVLPAAVHFFQNFNSAQFNVLVQASQYYKFAATTLLAMGLVFQVPLIVLGVTRAGVITPRQLRRNRRYAVAAAAVVAAFLPGDAVTMLLETVPLYLLFEISVVVASIAERRSRIRRRGVDRRGVGRFVIPSLQRQTSDRQPRSVSVPFCAERPGCRLTPA